ncbi:DMT family transporter [Thiomicrorhabdus lithotrophica]|uniref:DMT family transporter n=1 Tax=Thiomicrorhabdus lithotrophica TaxID=2949997 RepID=A0ABY8CG26_9GAMM|nr:DMT family transporter [Thiomicrorhabdus lithotrophica]WEJ63451.1 DMT family transporter [Thiomicrorhabdus lithotrophica]
MKNLTQHAQFPVLVLFVASFFWGLSWLPLKSLNQMGFDGAVLIFFSYGLLSLVFLPLLFLQRSYLVSHLKPWLLIFLLGGGANFVFNYALIYGEVIRVMVLFYLLPLWGVLGGKFFLHEHVDAKGWLAAGLAISGAFLIVGGFKVFETPPSWIDFLALLSGFLFAMNNVVFRANQDFPMIPKLSALFIGTTVMSGLLFFIQGAEIPQDVSLPAWQLLAFYGLVWLLISNYGSQWGVTHMPASRSSIIIITELVVAVISAVLIANETINLIEGVGGVLIVTAAVLEALRNTDEEKRTT